VRRRRSAIPFYSPGSDYISIESDMITDMVVRDFAGESFEQRKERSDTYDEFMRFRYEATMLLYRNQYPVLGSYETMRLKWNFDIACYYKPLARLLHEGLPPSTSGRSASSSAARSTSFRPSATSASSSRSS
jgi:hypothetical protein